MNDNDARLHATGNEAMRRVGYLLLLWGQLETKLAFGIHQLTPEDRRKNVSVKEVAKSLDRTLKDWRRAHVAARGEKTPHLSAVDRLKGEIEAASTMRNTLCHGMSAMILSPEPPFATICCYEKYHENRMIHGTMKQVFYDLPQLAEELQRLESFIRRVTDIDQSVWTNPRSNETQQEAG